jgi:hypothetical protein
LKKKPKKIVAGLVCVCITAILLIVGKNSLQITVTKIMHEKGYQIINQTPKSIEISIDKNVLPEDMDFSLYESSINYNIPVHKTDTSTIYLKFITYANEDMEWLSMNFDIEYNLPKEGSVVVVNEVKGDKTFSQSLYMSKNEVRGIDMIYEAATSIHGIGPSNQFAVYLRADVYDLLEEKIVFVIDGFNELEYIAK